MQNGSGGVRHKVCLLLENGGCKVTRPSGRTVFSRRVQPVFFLIRAAAIIGALLCVRQAPAQEDEGVSWNGFGTKIFTIESQHFTISYIASLEGVAREAGTYLENLYSIFRQTYGITLPAKTKILIIDGEITNGLADPNHNFIILWPHDFDINLRGTHDWLKGVVTHEFAHIVSINAGFKLPPWIPAIQIGYFSHPNEPNRVEALHIFPNEMLPPWFTEGIAQYEDMRHGTDSWDTHRDMIMRTLTLSGRLLPYDRMFEFAGTGDDLEKTYNHGFSLVTYIADTYGYDKVVSLLKDCGRFFRLDFNAAIKTVLGISGRQLYDDWKRSLEIKYNSQVKKLGNQSYGSKINKDGYDNYWPKFSPDEKKIYFISNGKADFSFFSKSMYSYNLSDTIKADKKIKMEKMIAGFYSIHNASGLVAYPSMKSSKSIEAPSQGGGRLFDLFIDTLPPDQRKFSLFKKKTERQVTKKQSVFSAVFSPRGDKLACAKRSVDKFFLCISDTNGKNFSVAYPDTSASPKPALLQYIYSLDWNVDGRHIAVSYIDTGFRRIGIYDTLTREFRVMKNQGHDDRDPRYSADGKSLYFSSDRTGIFNIYRYTFETQLLEQCTNVSGGAFSPDVSKNGKKLTFANYDKDGYGIYLIDSVVSTREVQTDSMFSPRQCAAALQAPRQVTADAHPYSRFPSMFMVAPTFIVEQAIPEVNNVFTGHSVFKAGAVAFFDDPLASAGMGTQFGAYLFLEPDKVLQLIDLDKGGWGRKINYDLGAFATTKVLPVEIGTNFLQRQIPGADYFYFKDSLGAPVMRQLNYAIILRYIDLMASHPLAGGLNLHALASYNWYEVYLLVGEAVGNPDYKDPAYFPAQGYRFGTYLSFLAPEYDQRMFISPRGLAAKLQYNFWSQDLLNEKGVTYENNMLKENYDLFNYHEVSGTLKFGMTSPWLDYHDIYAEAHATVVVPNEIVMNNLFHKDYPVKELPSFYKPVEWLKGYTYFFKDTLRKADNSQDSVIFDTCLVTGNAVAAINLSYRFPLWPTVQMGARLWFINFDQLYGAVNFGAAAGWQSAASAFKFNRDDWLTSAGLELRLKAKSFGIPLALGLRYDYGFNRPASLGGDHITFSLGFGFDNWDLIDMPDYYASIATR
jgi:Tol biopolymer transport system component